MKYTTYYEDSCMIGYSGYEQMKAMVERENPNGILEHVKVRKLKFENTEIENQRLAGDEGIPLYSICLKNLDENRLYLEKKSRQKKSRQNRRKKDFLERRKRRKIRKTPR